MSGHSKWSTIKHKKAKEDAKRGKVFTKVIKEIMVAAREGGGDPEGNAKLRSLIEKAKTANMPQENIRRAIKKATGTFGGVHYEEIRYEGYGPFGTAVIVETLTDNKKRTVADVRHIFSKHGGNLAEGGAVAWMFEHKGVLRVSGNLSEDELFEKVMEHDVDDISYHDGIFTITCSMQNLAFVKQAVLAADMKVEDAQVEWVAKDAISLEQEQQDAKIIKFLEALQDLDDVRDVYTNLS